MKTTTYLSNLTPLRGIAALLTVIFHIDLMLGHGGNMLIKYKDSLVLSKMYLMVDFFFILSGFIMLHVYGKGFAEKVTKSEFKRFTIARFARVYPLHLATLVYTVLLFAVSNSVGLSAEPIIQTENHGFSLFTNLFLLHSMNLHQWFSWNHASWSISTEWWMYMVFPFLVLPFSKLGYWGKAIVALLCFVGYLSITVFIVPILTVPDSLAFLRSAPAQPVINVAYQFGFLRCLFGFVLGMMMYKGYQKEWGKSILANGYTILALTLGFMICMHFAVPDVFTVIFFPLILLSAAYGSKGMNVFLGSKPLQKLGDWSFSIYLTHQPLMFTISSIIAYQSLGQPKTAGPPPQPTMLMGWLICLAFIALTLVVSSFTYRFLEVPARRWLNAQATSYSSDQMGVPSVVNSSKD
ncbi:MAG: acyltransferase [Saprospiraceae bacterium]|nr:acyltransferase [Saprospiraceae bacterium]